MTVVNRGVAGAVLDARTHALPWTIILLIANAVLLHGRCGRGRSSSFVFWCSLFPPLPDAALSHTKTLFGPPSAHHYMAPACAHSPLGLHVVAGNIQPNHIGTNNAMAHCAGLSRFILQRLGRAGSVGGGWGRFCGVGGQLPAGNTRPRSKRLMRVLGLMRAHM